MRKKTKRQNYFIDFLTSLMMTIAIVVAAYFIHIYQQPLSILNPFPPIEEPMGLPEDIISSSLTETIAYLPTKSSTLPPTETKTNTPTPQPTSGLTATNALEETLYPTATPDPEKIVLKLVTPPENVDEIFYTPTPHPIADYMFEFAMLHEAKAQQSPWNMFVSNPILNCNWFGVGGQVFDYHGNPMAGVNIKLGGNYPDSDEFIELYTVTEFDHVQGDGGYEFKLSNKPLNASSFWVQVVDEEFNAISAKAHFTITEYCTVNLIRIDFVQVK